MTSILPNPESTFNDADGAPLAGGFVYTYIPGTLTPKATWQDIGQAILNTNPIVLDSAGRALIYGAGQYRFRVLDSLSNLQYDKLTQSTLAEDVISTVMLPIVGAATTATARTLLGVDQAIQTAINTVSLIPGPIGPTGPMGFTGPTGPGATGGGGGSGSIDVQAFTSNGSWVKPAFGTLTTIQMWGAGGASSGTYGGGGGGGYVSITVLTADLATCVVTIGIGGPFIFGSSIGINGTDTTFGSYLTMRGGAGGNADPAGSTGASGSLTSASGVTIVDGSFDYGFYGSNTLDAYGNPYQLAPYSGTAGIASYSGALAPIQSIFGGTGGGVGGNGAYPGGGGGANGGSGANGKVVVTTR